MKKTSLALAVAAVAAFSSQAVLAQDYQMEAGVNYTSFDYDAGGDDSAIGVDFRYNFETVSTSGKPLTEAQFLGRNGGANFAYSTQDKADTTTIRVGADYWFEDIYVSANLVNTDASWTGDKETGINVKVGYMLNDGLRVHAGLSTQTEVDGFGLVDETGISIGAKYVSQLGDNYINLEGEITNVDSEQLFNVAGDYFITNEISVGAEVAESSISGDKTLFGVNAKYFFIPTVSGELSYTTKDSNNTIGLRVAARF